MTSLFNLKSLRSNRIISFFIMGFSAVARQKSRMDILGAVWRIAGRNGLSGLKDSFRRFINLGMTYERWISLHDTLGSEDKKAIRRHISMMSEHPVISVLMPACETNEIWLRRSIESVRRQIYPHWELLISDHLSAVPHLRTILEEFIKSDKRIRLVQREQNDHIPVSSGSLTVLVRGEFTTILYPHDELPQHALYMAAAVLNEKPFLDLIYTDEDRIDENGLRSVPYFKPDWNPDLLTSQNFISRLCVYRTETFRAAGGFPEDFENFMDWDLALRVSTQIPAASIHHIPHILYHRRSPTGKTWQNSGEKDSALNVLQEHLDRTLQKGRVFRQKTGELRIKYSLPANAPLVSIIIPTYNKRPLLQCCIESIINKTCYTNYEIIIVDNRSDDADTLDYLTSLEKAKRARVLKYMHPFNYSAINNFAAEAAEGEYLCLMNNDIEVISEDWLDEMVGHAARPGIGAVGAMLYYPDNTIQHAGVILLQTGIAGHLYNGNKRGTNGFCGRTSLVQNLSAVTAACLVIRKSTYMDAGGLDETNLPVSFNDVDFCLKVREKGCRNLWTPFAEFYHNESASRGLDDNEEKKARFQRETSHMITRWGNELCNDPAYNPNLTFYNGSIYLSSEPKAEKPWAHFYKGLNP
jgi:O-antigen biosynthesis protein